TPNGRNRGEPAAWKHARRVRRAAWGNEPMATSGTAPQADSTTRLVEIVDSLPVTATGKILKRELAP
ncbi:MAG: hypothetical protein QOE89_3215, partial [Pseudonocardiales bacterium]|nr:hypothetical protein [Pseudonocardiales bacterium]